MAVPAETHAGTHEVVLKSALAGIDPEPRVAGKECVHRLSGLRSVFVETDGCGFRQIIEHRVSVHDCLAPGPVHRRPARMERACRTNEPGLHASAVPGHAGPQVADELRKDDRRMHTADHARKAQSY
jgi:hypothetical protein